MRSELKIISESSPAGCNAFKLGSDIKLSLNVAGVECEKIWVFIGNDDKVVFSGEVGFYRVHDEFFAGITVNTQSLTGKAGLFFCHFEFLSPDGKRHYTAFDGDSVCYISDKFMNELQFTVYDDIYKSPDWFAIGAVYQIFPDRFARGGDAIRREDAVYDEDWENGVPEYPHREGRIFKNNTHFGGTLWGAADKLEYIASLGVTCVYFNPIFDAYSNHKYDTGDYLHVDKTFGGDEALAHFINKAHSLGIAVVLDGVFNHVGSDSIYFNKDGKYQSVGAYQSKESPYYKWFTFIEHPDVYEAWWGIKTLPRTVRCREFRDFITKTVIPRYMAMGVDGWRLDVVDELEADFVDEIAKAVKGCKSDAVLIGEVWEDASNKEAYGERKRYFLGAQLDSVMNYPLRNGIINYMLYGDPELLVDTVNTLYAHYPVNKQKTLLNFLGSHDTERITTILGGDGNNSLTNDELAVRKLTKQARDKAKKLLVNAYKLLAGMPGVPCIYYGDEIALEGYHDPFNRRPFPVGGFSDEFSQNFAVINKTRAAYKDYFLLPQLIAEAAGNNALKITRSGNGKKLYILGNTGDKPVKISIEGTAIDIFDGKAYNELVGIPANSVLLLRSEV